MNRRDTVLALLALGILPFPVWAQPAQKVYRIGLLSLALPRKMFVGIIAALSALGYEEGRNVEFLYRLAEGGDDRLPNLAADPVEMKADVFVTILTT